MKTSLQIEISFKQILSMVKQLPVEQKKLLSKELEKEVVDSKLSYLLKIFKTKDLDEEIIRQEVEAVRQGLYDKQKC